MGKALTLSAAKARHAAEQRGSWFQYQYGGRFRIRYYRTPDFSRRREQFMRDERTAAGLRDEDPLPVDARNRATARAMYGTIVAEWDEIQLDETGAPLEFTEANLVDLLTTDLDLANEIYAYAEKRTNHHDAALGAQVRD